VVTFDCAVPGERERGIRAAVAAVRVGRLVVLPTDTVYGIGATAQRAKSVASLHAAKGRTDTPSPVLIGSRDELDGLVDELPDAARGLADAFWPGGLTIVLRHAARLDWSLGGAPGTAGFRMPAHPVALAVLAETGPMAVSSANLHGKPPARTAAEALEQFGGAADVYLEAGPLPTDRPSTVVTLAGGPPRVLRAGAVPLDSLRAVVPDLRAD
jgi:tRNA threonylcarbamoyl adenosine modification protein (Sua5/YciO/YrdC/YwlC family)